MKKLIVRTLGVFLLACFFITSSVFAGHNKASGMNMPDKVMQTKPAKKYYGAYYWRHHRHHKHYKKLKKYKPKPWPKYKVKPYKPWPKHKPKPWPKPTPRPLHHGSKWTRRPMPHQRPLPPMHKPMPKPMRKPPVVMNPKN